MKYIFNILMINRV